MSEQPEPRHLDADALADLQEGLLDGDGEATARRHLEACADCRADLASLTDLPALLAAAGDVGPVPELVAARLDRALAAEAVRPAVPTATRTITPELSAARGPVRGMRLLQAAAALVLVLGAGAIGISALPHGGDNSTSAGSAGAADSAGGSAAAEAAHAPVTASGRNWTRGTLTAAAPSLAAGTYGPPFSLLDRKAAARDDAGGATPSPSAGTLSGSPSIPPEAAAAGPASRLADPASLAACVVTLADGGPVVQPLAVDLATYEGKPAAVLVFPAADDRAALDVYVVAPDCPTGLFLDFLRVPRS
ncbi:MAG: hypothetical protein ABI807_01360 [Sporichthyaceae bacterium]